MGEKKDKGRAGGECWNGALMGVKPQNAAPESWEDPARHRGEAVTSAWHG